ncbi:MAG: TIM barrel protein [Chloroflexi bacterium]|nr:TIM barrel protein [Chloroflexota bacterium]MBV9896719.1 TIM barrel protein [Chloroflexota bacterium]
MNKLVNSPQNLGSTPPLEYVEASIKAGYDAIGIRTYRAPGLTYNFNPIVGRGQLEGEVKRALADSGLEVYDNYSFYLRPDMEWDLILPALEFGGEVGCKYVLVIGDDPEWQRMCDNFGRICDFVAPMGQTVAVEATVRSLSPVTTAVQFMEDCKRQNVGICLDPRQTFRDEHGFAALATIDRKWLPYAQLNDSSPVVPNAGLLPGEGVVPLNEYLDGLPEGIDISVEAQIPAGGIYTGAEWAKISVERIKRFLTAYEAAKVRV